MWNAHVPDRDPRVRAAGVLPAAIVLVLGIVLTVVASHATGERQRERTRGELDLRATAVAGTLEQILLAHSATAAALGEWAAASLPVDPQAFRSVASRLLGVHEGIRALGLAPDGVVRYVHPVAGNEQAIGLDLREVAGPEAMRLLDAGASFVLDGPVDLAQGGRAAIIRVRVDEAEGNAQETRRPWGIATNVIDLDALLDEAGLLRGDLDWALHAGGSAGEIGRLVAGQDLSEAAPATARIELPGAVWQVAVVPGGGWSAADPDRGPILATGLALAVALALLTFVLWRQPALLRRDVQLATAEVRASRDRTRAVMNAAGDAIIAIDRRGDVVEANPAALRLLRIDDHALRGRPIRGFVDVVAVSVTEQRDGQRLGRAPLTVRRADGSNFPAEVCVAWPPAAQVRTVVIRDVTDQRRQEADLQRHVLELQRLNSEQLAIDVLKRDFMQMASHEIRTPLTAIRGFAQTLNRHWDVLPPEDRERSLDAIHRQATRLWQLLDNLLTTAQLEGGGIEQCVEAIEVPAVIGLAVAEAQLADDHVTVHADDDLTANVDADHLTRVLVALLTNAGKYGAPPIDVTAALDDGDLVIRVADHGMGVPYGFRSRLFEPFSQASTGVRREAVGTGLGLAVARGLARANGGDVWHEDHPGVGATFALRLPARPSQVRHRVRGLAADGMRDLRVPSTTGTREATGRSRA